MATLTFVYSDSTAVIGPLATAREPHSWDLCVGHAGRITAPRGWDLVRHSGPLPTHPEDDDLVALADAVREGDSNRAPATNGWPPEFGVGGVSASATGALTPPGAHPAVNGRRRGHLRVLPDPTD